MANAVITLLTDFGTADGYAGEMKGVLLSHVPDATIVDIAHDLPAHDVRFAGFTLGRYWKRFPEGTVHLVVVDPGVGSARRAIAVSSEGRFLVGPDNGVLTAALVGQGARAVELPVDAHAAPTFHGRDVFAPAAARLASGVPLSTLGRAVQAIVLRAPEPEQDHGRWRGEVMVVDRFGNAITNLSRDVARVVVAGRELRVVRTYADVPPGEPLALIGSSGVIEIAVRDGRATDVLRLVPGTPVEGLP